MNLAYCKYCNKLKVKNNTGLKKSSRGFIYRDENLRPWDSAHCPECKRARHLRYKRARGTRHINHLTTGSMFIGRQAEKRAAIWLSGLGYHDIKLNNGKGPDITAIRHNLDFTFEVKSVSKQSNNIGLFVHKVAPTRVNDDYVICVKGNEFIMQSMEKHLAMEKKHAATVTNLFKRVAGVKHYEILPVKPKRKKA